ncbi:ATP-binding protein [Chryseobacterium arthrosphaerae]|uniref:AlbA family DNA-binding domain-containing protein n=1 Tax=Chryseobacterium arthrosphaerae TaxID=651561 RepID=UPI0023E1DC58|nr:ATP-binding protein [Chryseobacterium arthrosphaerae]WES96505.1 ATP-binding protein [Chryseobacterium arthrosphaerae]
MNLQEEVSSILLQEESETLEYKAVLPPSKSIAQIIASFANTNGGLLVLGVSEIGGLKVAGLSEDFRATSIVHKAIDLLSPRPIVDYGYVKYQNKKLFAVKVKKSAETILIEDKIFIRKNKKLVVQNLTENVFQPQSYDKIVALNTSLESVKKMATDSKLKLLEHYQSILKMLDNLKSLLYPIAPNKYTDVKEGKILARILFSSVVDNFETYLSDILFEIYLANPDTLKSEQLVKVEDVLNCADIQEFVTFWAKQKIGKLQKGSVKGFIADNKQIRDLNVIDKPAQEEIEKILQIRHLYAHRNGIVDDKFLKFFPSDFVYGSEHQLSIDEILDKIKYLSEVIEKIDNAAIKKYNLSTI